MADEIRRVAPRVQTHVDALREAGLNTEAFFDALVGIRDDTRLSTPQRDALYRLIAGESFIWYLEALRGQPIDRIALMEEAQKIAEKNAVAIKRPVPGENAAELLIKTMADDGAETKLERPPRTTTVPAGEATVRQRPPKRPPDKRPPISDAPTLLDRPPPKKK